VGEFWIGWLRRSLQSVEKINFVAGIMVEQVWNRHLGLLGERRLLPSIEGRLGVGKPHRMMVSNFMTMRKETGLMIRWRSGVARIDKEEAIGRGRLCERGLSERGGE